MGLFAKGFRAPKTAHDAAVEKFPVGCKVRVRTDRPEWNDRPQCDQVVCGHVRYRDSDDDPMVCVCLVATTGAVAGWFTPDNMIRAEDL